MAAPFVAREKELRHLDDILRRSLEGTGQVCFVTGEAGAGKSALAAEFARRAQARHSELLFAVGNCNAQSGIGDPYLPFREILGQLTGDVESKLTQGAISEENASRLRQFLSFSGRAVVDLGPDLIDIFVPGAALVTRASQMVAGRVGWRKRLEHLREQHAQRPDSEFSSQGSQQGSEQSQIFEQFTRVMLSLAVERPLVILVDDLHWADESSASLLFHLARRIENSRIMLFGAYRPEDVALGRGDRRHPLETVVNEIKRQYGDVQVPLAEDQEGGRAFIDALLDARPNRLGEGFRRKLLRHTRGQPLFTTELLNGMRNRGDLVEAPDGALEEGPSLDWDTLPARIEGVIEERIHRLPAGLQELLTVASVEGEVFSAQVIAPLHELGEREVLRALDRELDQHYHLVREDGIQRIGRRRLSRYRFRHNLIQRYLYNNISDSRRELLHEDIARGLEEVYAENTEEISGLLAQHYELGRLPELAADHYLAASLRAMRMFAGDEAAGMLTRALELLQELPGTPENDERTVRLLLALGRAQWKQGLAPESMGTFQRAAELARKFGSGEYLAQAALGYDNPRFRFNFPPEPAVQLLDEALESLGPGDSMLRVRVVCGLIRAQGHRMPAVVLDALIDEAIAMARRLDDPHALYTALVAKLLAYRQPEKIGERLAVRGEILQSAEQIGDQTLLLDAHVLLIDDLLAMGNIDAVDRDMQAMSRVVEEVGEPFYDYCRLTKLAMRALLAGRFTEAERLAQQGLDCSQQMVVDNAEGVYGLQMFSIRRLQGRLRALAPVISSFVTTHRESASWRPGLALVYSEIGDEAAARAEFERLAADRFAGIPEDSLWQACLSYMADVCAFLGDARQAPVLYELLEPYAELAIVVGNSITCNGAASRSLGRLAALIGEWDLAEAHFRHAIELNTRLQALPWLAHTRYQYAVMLSRRSASGGRERAGVLLEEARELADTLGMQGLTRDLEAMRETG